MSGGMVDTTKPADPATRDCDFCEAGAVVAYEILRGSGRKRTGTFAYACGRHKIVAHRSANRDPEEAP